MAERIMQHLPDFYRQILEFMELDITETIELEKLDLALEQVYDDQFVLSSSEAAVERRERMLGIQADPTIESLDFRKMRILNRYQTKPPFTIRYLQQRLDFLVGKGRTTVEVDPVNFILTVIAAIDEAAVFKEVEYTVKTTIPANLYYQQQTALKDVIKLVENISKREITWNYKFDDTWKLGEKPFGSLGTEMIIK
ncbi:putative phage tail protein [Cytobacillus purgationiresistens]|uniref:DUF2313 domain-containing protein n=1 Tax=Cytobacillus purgationiresistens TaxID=863449 RepID=A0ABU0AF89_9BACI|nr:putative phage tail protein [Cytobacillus purgationiresistens]MDQ0269927.1 hypothetical protein [Cytobacillus purgationiresistens]